MNCPDCRASCVSVEVGLSGTGRLTALVVRSDEGDVIEVVRACWACGWRETRKVAVDSIAVEPGDPDVVARRWHLHRLTEAISEFDTDELRDTIDAVERIGQR